MAQRPASGGKATRRKKGGDFGDGSSPVVKQRFDEVTLLWWRCSLLHVDGMEEGTAFLRSSQNRGEEAMLTSVKGSAWRVGTVRRAWRRQSAVVVEACHGRWATPWPQQGRARWSMTSWYQSTVMRNSPGSWCSSGGHRRGQFAWSGYGDTVELDVMVAGSGTMDGAIIDVSGGPTVALLAREDKVKDEAE